MATDSIVVIKVNQQWVGVGDGSGQGRLGTSTDLLKGLIWRILNHPDGFIGEVVVAENVQDAADPDFATRYPGQRPGSESNSGRRDHRLPGSGAAGFPAGLDPAQCHLLPGGDFGPLPATCEYSHGNMDDGYVLLNDSTSTITPTNGYSYPKFRTAQLRYVSMRHGLWEGGSYHPDRVVLINMPVLKKHCMASATAAWKNLIGFQTLTADGRFGGLEYDAYLLLGIRDWGEVSLR